MSCTSLCGGHGPRACSTRRRRRRSRRSSASTGSGTRRRTTSCGRRGRAARRPAARRCATRGGPYLDECEARRVEEAAARREARRGLESDNEDDYEVIQEDVTDIIDIQQEVDTSRKMLDSEDERD
eukprot:TRINITY_DN7806_c0_g1_i3.p1 TRINITY_DN7806_c0_g1~~TRINITY_DN7806_c0_g1_i3.p1  ORF type:complete len:126 (+),score=28.69 TRINITY_DN7806_c0_g1_i3:306-683(+)